MMSLIISTSNPRIKQIRKLHDRKERQSSGLFYIEGLRIVAEALSLNASVETLIVSPELLISDFGRGLVDQYNRSGVPILEVSESVFKSLALKEGPQGIAAVVRQRWENLNAIDRKERLWWVALESVADPGNLGAILRTADAVGVAGVILLDYATDPYDPTAIRASMGAVFSQRLIKSNYAEFALWKKRIGIPVVGTSDSAVDDYHRVKYPPDLVLLMGSERQGLSKPYLDLCDLMVRIPMMGRSDSLNLSVATAITLYEILNQQRDNREHASLQAG